MAEDFIDPDTGEVLYEANSIITEEVLETLRKHGVKEVKTLFTNDLDRGPFISETMRIDSTRSQLEGQVEIYRMMRPGEPPTKDASQNLFENLFFNPDRYDLSAVGRMKFNRRLAKDQMSVKGFSVRKILLRS